MDSSNEISMLIVALKFYAQRTRRVSMFKIVDQLVEILEEEGYRFSDIMEGFRDFAEHERARTERLHEEDKQLA